MTLKIPPPPVPLPPCPVPLPPEDRDAQGRFKPGNSGKRKGTRNRASALLSEMFEDEAEAIGRVAIDRALKGDIVALKLILDRLCPMRRGTPIEIKNFPVVKTVVDIPAAHSALFTAVAAGEVSPEEAAPLSAMLGGFSSSLDAVALAVRIDELERRLDESKRGSAGPPETLTFGLDVAGGSDDGA